MATRTDAMKPSDLARVVIDTTVQPMGCRVYDERQLFWTAIAKGVDQDVGKSGAAKARYENGRSIRNVGESLCGCPGSFVHRHRWYASLFEPAALPRNFF